MTLAGLLVFALAISFASAATLQGQPPYPFAQPVTLTDAQKTEIKKVF